MSSPESSPADHRVEFLPETVEDANRLGLDLRREIARLVIELSKNVHLGELMGDRPPRILKGCRKVRFDLPEWGDKPRYRLVYRNEPTDGAVAVASVLAIGRRDRMVAYARASSRLRKRVAEEGLSGP
jgi:hypothetical protein